MTKYGIFISDKLSLSNFTTSPNFWLCFGCFFLNSSLLLAFWFCKRCFSLLPGYLHRSWTSESIACMLDGIELFHNFCFFVQFSSLLESLIEVNFLLFDFIKSFLMVFPLLVQFLSPGSIRLTYPIIVVISMLPFVLVISLSSVLRRFVSSLAVGPVILFILSPVSRSGLASSVCIGSSVVGILSWFFWFWLSEGFLPVCRSTRISFKVIRLSFSQVWVSWGFWNFWFAKTMLFIPFPSLPFNLCVKNVISFKLVILLSKSTTSLLNSSRLYLFFNLIGLIQLLLYFLFFFLFLWFLLGFCRRCKLFLNCSSLCPCFLCLSRML